MTHLTATHKTAMMKNLLTLLTNLLLYQSPQAAKNVNIAIRVFNRGWIKNELVGLAQYDLSSIYFQENHKVEHQWVGLENPDAEDFENMKGLLKISANVIGPKDNAQKLEPHVGPEPDKMKMFMSPSIKRTFN